MSDVHPPAEPSWMRRSYRLIDTMRLIDDRYIVVTKNRFRYVCSRPGDNRVIKCGYCGRGRVDGRRKCRICGARRLAT